MFNRELFLGSANTIYCVVVDSSNSEEKMRDSISFWMKFITAFSPKESKTNSCSVLLVGNKYDSLNWSDQRRVSDFFSQYEKLKILSHSCVVSAKNLTFISNLRRHLQLQVQEIFQSNNDFFQVPRVYKELANKLSKYKELLMKAPVGYSDSCFSFLQDMGIVLFNRRTKMICLNPQILAKAIACFVMPPEHEKLVYEKIAPHIKNLSIIPGVFFLTVTI